MSKLKAKDVLYRYEFIDRLPEFIDTNLTDVNQRGNFGSTPLNVACVRGIPEEVNALVEQGADVNAKEERGYTPLHNAAVRNFLEIADYLLSHGADPSILNDDGDSPSDLARLFGFDELSAYLESKIKK